MITIHRNRLLAKHLLDTAAHLAEQTPAAVHHLGTRLLALSDDDPPRRGRSILNNDGTLLQVSLSSKPGGWGLRLIGDPAADRADPRQRHARAYATLEAMLTETDSEALRDACDLALQHLLANDLSIYTNGTLWIAAGLGKPGIAFYVDAKPPGAETAWRMARAWLSAALDDPHPALTAIDALERFAIPASFGIEGSAPKNARAKIYFRLKDSTALADWGLPLFRVDAFARYLSIAMADFDVSGDGFVVSLGFSMATGELVDGKIDLCGCQNCLNYSAVGWTTKVRELEATFDLAPLPLAAVLTDARVQVAFIGLGLEAAKDQPRLNVYLKSNLGQLAPTQTGIRAALADAIDYLRATQQPDGHWNDYALPVGRAEGWVTGYVGLALAEAGADEPARRAADWLTAHRSYAAGWGYNAITGPDADSTAFALRLQQTLGDPVSAGDQAFLRGLWQQGGGFATYPQDDAWGIAHPDVTPLAYLSLPADDQATLRDELLAYIRRTRLPNGLWPAYWWRQPFYCTYLMLTALHDLGWGENWLPEPTVDEQYEITDAFNLAALIGVGQLRGQNVTPLVRALLAQQNPDGSWEGAANLRVTDPDCYAPWDDPRGQTYVDFNRTITTATALRVLARLADQEKQLEVG